MTTQTVVPVTVPPHLGPRDLLDTGRPREDGERLPPVGTRRDPGRHTAAAPARGVAADAEDAGDEPGRWALSVMCGVAALVPCSCPVVGPWT
jgi:hypothetical protein